MSKGVKKNTTISKIFIDEYYKFYEQCENTKFGIKIEDIMKYLNLTSQYKFEERLRNNFIINIDYIIIKYNQKATKNIRNVQYMFSFEGFEKVCMASNTEKGKSFRDNVIMIHRLL